MTLVQHSSARSDWGTPLRIVDAVRAALGGSIYLDPATSEAANVGIQATHGFEPPIDGLKQDWDGRTVFCNPPGGTDRTLKARWGTNSRQVAWWRKALLEFHAGHVQQLVFLAFSIELMQTAQTGGHLGPLNRRFGLCVPRQRIAFDRVAEDGSRTPGKSPSHANILIGLGVAPGLWEREMLCVGQVMGARA